MSTTMTLEDDQTATGLKTFTGVVAALGGLQSAEGATINSHLGATPSSNIDISILASFGNDDQTRGDKRVLDICTDPGNNAVLRAVGRSMTLSASEVDTTGPIKVLQKVFGGNAGIEIAGLSSSANWGNLGFSTQNGAGADVLVASITGQITNSTTGSEAGDLIFATGNAGTVSEKLRIYSDGSIHAPGNLSVGGDIASNALKVSEGVSARVLSLYCESDEGGPSILFYGEPNTTWPDPPQFQIGIDPEGGALDRSLRISAFPRHYPSPGVGVEPIHVVEIKRITGEVLIGSSVTLTGDNAPARLTIKGDDSNTASLIISGQKSTVTAEKWGEYSLTATATGLLCRNNQTGNTMFEVGAGPATGTDNGGSGNGKDGDFNVPFDMNVGGLLVVLGGGPGVGKIMRCTDATGTGNWDSIQPSDFPGIDASKTTTGVFAVDRVGTWPTGSTPGDISRWLRGDGTWRHLGVASISAISASPIHLIDDGVGAISLDLKDQATNTVWAGPSAGSSAGTPSFRALVVADLPVTALTETIASSLASVFYTKSEADALFPSTETVASMIASAGFVDSGTMYGAISSATSGFVDSGTVASMISSALSNYFTKSESDARFVLA